MLTYLIKKNVVLLGFGSRVQRTSLTSMHDEPEQQGQHDSTESVFGTRLRLPQVQLGEHLDPGNIGEYIEADDEMRECFNQFMKDMVRDIEYDPDKVDMNGLPYPLCKPLRQIWVDEPERSPPSKHSNKKHKKQRAKKQSSQAFERVGMTWTQACELLSLDLASQLQFNQNFVRCVLTERREIQNKIVEELEGRTKWTDERSQYSGCGVVNNLDMKPPCNNVFYGQFKNGQWHGSGMLCHHNTMIKGLWLNNALQPLVIQIVDSEQFVFFGYSNARIRSSNDGKQSLWSTDHAKLKDLGTYLRSNGSVYCGSIMARWMPSEGTYMKATGEVLMGTFENKRLHGEGIYLSADHPKWLFTGNFECGRATTGHIIKSDGSCFWVRYPKPYDDHCPYIYMPTHYGKKGWGAYDKYVQKLNLKDLHEQEQLAQQMAEVLLAEEDCVRQETKKPQRQNKQLSVDKKECVLCFNTIELNDNAWTCHAEHHTCMTCVQEHQFQTCIVCSCYIYTTKG